MLDEFEVRRGEHGHGRRFGHGCSLPPGWAVAAHFSVRGCRPASPLSRRGVLKLGLSFWWPASSQPRPTSWRNAHTPAPQIHRQSWSHCWLSTQRLSFWVVSGRRGGDPTRARPAVSTRNRSAYRHGVAVTPTTPKHARPRVCNRRIALWFVWAGLRFRRAATSQALYVPSD